MTASSKNLLLAQQLACILKEAAIVASFSLLMVLRSDFRIVLYLARSLKFVLTGSVLRAVEGS